MAIRKIKIGSNRYEVNDSRIPGIDTVPTAGSDNVITSGAVYDALQGAGGGGESDIVIDADPVAGSPNAVSSGGVYEAIAEKQDAISDLATIRNGAAAGSAAYRKPNSGIPARDLEDGVIPIVPEISTNIAADASSDSKTVSPKAVKDYVDAHSGGGSSDSVLYTEQALTSTQKRQARENIGAGTYDKPSTGIPASDLESGVIPDAVEANPTVPSGTTPTDLSGLKIGSGYYNIPQGGGGGGGTSFVTEPTDLELVAPAQSGQPYKLQFADRLRESNITTGENYIILRETSTFASQVETTDTIYEIRTDFDLLNTSVSIPSGCILRFVGGKIKNGTVIGNNTKIIAPEEQIFDNITLSGTWKSTTAIPEWLGAVGDGTTDDSAAIQSAINAFDIVTFNRRNYAIASSLLIRGSDVVYGGNNAGYTGKTIHGNNAKIIVTENVDAIRLIGYGSFVHDLTVTYKPNIAFSTALLRIESLNANAVRQTCYNDFSGLKLVSSENVPGGTGYKGIGLQLISDGANATYHNKFTNCFIADMQYGIKIENGASAGINSCDFIIDISNCDWLVHGNPGGCTFIGSYQAGFLRTQRDNVCFYFNSGLNQVYGFCYDVGTYDAGSIMCPLAEFGPDGTDNTIDLSCDYNSFGGNYLQNRMRSRIAPITNRTNVIVNNDISKNGQGGLVMNIAPKSNSLNTPNVHIGLATTNVSAIDADIYKYAERDAQTGFPTDLKYLSGNDSISRDITFTLGANAEIRFLIEIPLYSLVQSLHLYSTNRRKKPISAKAVFHTGSFAGPIDREISLDVSSWVGTYLYCIDFHTGWDWGSAEARFIEIVLNYDTGGTIGFSHISGVIEGFTNGPICECKAGFGSGRPNNLTKGDTGYMFFDENSGKPTWWNGTAWVDATGTAI